MEQGPSFFTSAWLSSVPVGALAGGAQSQSLFLAALCQPLQCSSESDYHIHLLVPHKLSPEWISSFLSCCCASRLDLPAGLTPSSICWCFCTANANRTTSLTVPPPPFPCFTCPAPLTYLALACSAEITTFNSGCGLR